MNSVLNPRAAGPEGSLIGVPGTIADLVSVKFSQGLLSINKNFWRQAHG